MQPAEPITYGHYLMAFHDAILRDLQRLEEYYFRLNLSPMGGCALAGTSIAIDRRMVAALLGFNGLVENSLDAVGSRDFALEFLANMSQLAVDISRLTEDFIFYTTPEAGQLQLPDELAFTSSIMPQKKNPDIIELARAKCAIHIGAYSQTATILHSLPSSYNLDLQEITPNIWVSSRAMQDVAGTVRILISRTSVRDVDVNRTDFVMTTATEAANILVTELGIPFRLAHQIVGSAASEFSRDRAKRADSWLDILIQKAREMTGNQSKELKARLARALSVGDIVARKKSLGSPAPRETLRLLRARSVILKRVISRQRMRRNLAASAKTQLRREVLRLGR
jgi:argininosuccinate lyase